MPLPCKKELTLKKLIPFSFHHRNLVQFLLFKQWVGALRLDLRITLKKIATIVVPVYTVGDPNEEINDSAFKSLYQLIST